MDYIIKVVPMEIAKQQQKDRETREQIEREKRYQEYLNLISNDIATRLANGYGYGYSICYRSNNPRIFFDEELCLKAARAVAEAYKSEGYLVSLCDYSDCYKKICQIIVYTK